MERGSVNRKKGEKKKSSSSTRVRAPGGETKKGPGRLWARGINKKKAVLRCPRLGMKKRGGKTVVALVTNVGWGKKTHGNKGNCSKREKGRDRKKSARL